MATWFDAGNYFLCTKQTLEIFLTMPILTYMTEMVSFEKIIQTTQ
jgi:hypothetical protein